VCYLTHNDNIKIFDDVARHVELEENQLHAEKPVDELSYLRLRCEEHMALNINRARVRDINPIVGNKAVKKAKI